MNIPDKFMFLYQFRKLFHVCDRLGYVNNSVRNETLTLVNSREVKIDNFVTKQDLLETERLYQMNVKKRK